MTLYETLKKHGHSPFKAAEIVLDVKRGDTWAIRWIETLTGKSLGHRDDH